MIGLIIYITSIFTIVECIGYYLHKEEKLEENFKDEIKIIK